MAKFLCKKEYVKLGDTVHDHELPYSEVCMHMNVAGKTMSVKRSDVFAAQLIDSDGHNFSSPILLGEAGFYSDQAGVYRLIKVAEYMDA
jgi:hypothetical protein